MARAFSIILSFFIIIDLREFGMYAFAVYGRHVTIWVWGLIDKISAEEPRDSRNPRLNQARAKLRTAMSLPFDLE